MTKIADIVEALAAPLVAAAGCDLWDVEYLKEGGRWVLRIYIDRAEGVSTEHCETVSRSLETVLDDKDLIAEAYTLEVSSAGLERPLRRAEHYERSVGKLVEVALYAPHEGRKQLQGTLTQHDNQTTTITNATGTHALPNKDIAKVRWVFEFRKHINLT